MSENIELSPEALGDITATLFATGIVARQASEGEDAARIQTDVKRCLTHIIAAAERAESTPDAPKVDARPTSVGDFDPDLVTVRIADLGLIVTALTGIMSGIKTVEQCDSDDLKRAVIRMLEMRQDHAIIAAL